MTAGARISWIASMTEMLCGIGTSHLDDFTHDNR